MAAKNRKRKLENIESEPLPKKRRKTDDNKQEVDGQQKYVFILAHGAGSNSKHANIVKWRQRIEQKGHAVVTFDFPKPYNKMKRLVDTYQTVIDSTAQKYATHKLVLIGTSMGSRVSIHLANNNSLPAQCSHIIALGYPLYAKRKTGNITRDEPLLKFMHSADLQLQKTRLLLISGMKDPMAPQQIMNGFYDKVKDMKLSKRVSKLQKCALHWIEGADHCLKVGKRHSMTQDEVDQSVIDIISSFIIDG